MRILYFAWLRERLDRDADTVSPPKSVQTVADLLDWLSARDETFALAVSDRSLIRAALDDRLVDHDTPLDGAATAAFFPPMTGG